MNKNEAPPIFVWTLALGATGFVAGFFGPMIFNPQANQGPLLGLLITGPLGVAAGFALGLVFKWLPIAVKHKSTALLSICVVTGVVILYFCLPEPKAIATVIDGKVEHCGPPADRMEKAIKDWEQRIAMFTASQPRAGWKEDTRRMLSEEGVALTILTTRQARILEHRKPWDFGRVTMTPWESKSESRPYFARFAGGDCEAYGEVAYPLYIAAGQIATAWPPTELSNFLGLAVIEPVPEKYRALIE